jgi:ariadne-1
MKTEKKMEEMQLTTDLTWIEVQFMKKAVDIVENCRTTLKWTYSMAYYLQNGNQKAMFEDNQRSVSLLSRPTSHTHTRLLQRS